MKIKKGDNIKIISGKDRGKTAKVMHVDTKRGTILAEGLNLKKKHVRPREQGKRGQIIEIPAPFRASTAMLVCPSCQKPTRVGAREKDAAKVRICRKCKAEI